MDTLLVIHECDLPKSKTLKEFGDVSISDSPFSAHASQVATMVAFITNSGDTKILKNRYGNSGIVVCEKDYANYLRLLQKEKDENNKLNNSPKKKRFLEGFRRFSIWPFHSA